jgi:hypothetical protein
MLHFDVEFPTADCRQAQCLAQLERHLRHGRRGFKSGPERIEFWEVGYMSMHVVPMAQDPMIALSYFAPLLVAGTIWLLAKLLHIGSREQSLPPGPPTTPFVGNALMMPSKFIHLK